MTIQITEAGEATVLSESDVVIAGLRADIESLRTQLRGARRAHEEDIRIIGETLIDEAERQDWCDRYDDAVSAINARLTIPLPVREREYEVTVTGYVRTPFTHTITLTIRADEDAEERAREDVEQLMSDVSTFDLDLDSYSSEIEEWEIDGVELA